MTGCYAKSKQNAKYKQSVKCKQRVAISNLPEECYKSQATFGRPSQKKGLGGALWERKAERVKE